MTTLIYKRARYRYVRYGCAVPPCLHTGPVATAVRLNRDGTDAHGPGGYVCLPLDDCIEEE